MVQDPFSYAHLANLGTIEELYQKYLNDPTSVESSWKYFFEGVHFASSILPKLPSAKAESPDLRIYLLIDAYRCFGHRMAAFNPLATTVAKEPIELSLERLGFKPEELNASFPTCGFLNQPLAPLSEIIDALKKTYCGTIGIEYMGLGFPEMETWVQEKIEPFFPLEMSSEDKLTILHELNKAELFESFLHTKYVGQKRFSLEGGETLIPMLSALINQGAQLGVNEVVLGMAHRGRLNVLANILNKSYAHIFHEFEDYYTPDLSEGSGDVKYHKGFMGTLTCRSGREVGVTLVANPSHLEAVDPVVEGIARAKQELKQDKTKTAEVVPILIHGDAALAGQGVVYETLQLSRLNGYTTHGTIHLVVNNQIGFTTLPKDARSTLYCTQVARAFGSPVFHVNAEDPEGCVRAALLAIQIRQKFGCDVFLDLLCYRKYGHNEGDEPFFTQPLEYTLIKAKKSIRTLFREQLIREKVLDEALAAELENRFKADLQQALEHTPGIKDQKKGEAQVQVPETPLSALSTALSQETLTSLAERLTSIPPDLTCHPKIKRLLHDRLEMVKTSAIDWGMAENLAYASLVTQGVHLRLSGQDVRRGTFSHRHAVWVDQVKDQKYFPLAHISPTQAPFDAYNSPLSEYAVLGFDFGYSVAYPQSLVIWEAQFGDFANGAQVIIDQFIASSEQKWNLCSNLTLLLPHGYEGQGPEHSSGRIERFLQLAGNHNSRVANCTTPAQFFHLLRAQALNRSKKPLIVFTPKALLRHPQCISATTEFTQGHFQEVLADPTPPSSVKKVLLCSGKVVYDLFQEREKQHRSDVMIIRIEQLYPFPEHALKSLLSGIPPNTPMIWVQEEHQNMGAWDYLHPLLERLFGHSNIQFVGRERSASPAAGSHALHQKQYEQFITQAFKG